MYVKVFAMDVKAFSMDIKVFSMDVNIFSMDVNCSVMYLNLLVFLFVIKCEIKFHYVYVCVHRLNTFICSCNYFKSCILCMFLRFIHVYVGKTPVESIRNWIGIERFELELVFEKKLIELELIKFN